MIRSRDTDPGRPEAAGESDGSVEMMRRLEAVTDTALTELSLPALLDELLERVRVILAADTAVILLLEGDDLVARAAKGLEEEVEQGVRVPLGRGFAGRVAAEKRPLIVDEVTQADVVNPLLRARQLRALLGVPILFEGGVVGVLHVGTQRPRAFGLADAQLLQVVADRVGLGIAYARLWDDERRTREDAEEARRELDAFFEEAAIGLQWIGADGTVLRANRAQLSLVGYAHDEYVGHHVGEFHADRSVADDLLARLAAGETVHDHEARLRCKDGSTRHVLIDCDVRRRHGRLVDARCFVRDVTAYRRAEDALRESEARYRRIVEIANEGVWLTDLEARTHFANHRMAELLGCAPEEMPGRNLLEFVFERDQPDAKDHFERNLHGVSEQFDFRFRRKDGGEILVLASTSPVTDAHGTVVGTLGMYSDITQRKRAETDREQLLAAAQEARAEAEAANRAKDQFLAVLSHELRSPLGAIRTWASLLARGNLDAEKIRRAAAAIERGVVTQTRLIQDLLDVSRISAGKLSLETERVELGAVVEAAFDGERGTAEEKGVRLEKAIAAREATVVGDPARLQQVVWNLIANAVKFSSAGGRVVVTLERDGGQAVIAVTDEGEGIAPELLPHVFERFRQGDSTSTREHGGLGLGLAIVRHLVELHGGRVTAESEGTGRGARFTVRLPLADALTSAPPPPARA